MLEIIDPIIPSNTDDKSLKKSGKQASKEADDEEEDDWESMFDDNGECVDPKVIDEVTAAVGKVSIIKPTSDYTVSREDIRSFEAIRNCIPYFCKSSSKIVLFL